MGILKNANNPRGVRRIRLETCGKTMFTSLRGTTSNPLVNKVTNFESGKESLEEIFNPL